MTSPIGANPLMDDGVGGDAYVPPRDLHAMAGVYLDHEPFVGFEFRDRNYRTMMSEDAAIGMRAVFLI